MGKNKSKIGSIFSVILQVLLGIGAFIMYAIINSLSEIDGGIQIATGVVLIFIIVSLYIFLIIVVKYGRKQMPIQAAVCCRPRRGCPATEFRTTSLSRSRPRRRRILHCPSACIVPKQASVWTYWMNPGERWITVFSSLFTEKGS